MLGEQSHGDGAAFALKANLIEHLHLHHGFDVLAFEADFFSVNRAWDAAHTAEDVRRDVAPRAYAFWVTPTEMQTLWRLVEDRFVSERPLIVAGIDPRHTGLGTPSDVAEALEDFVQRARLVVPIEDYDVFGALLEGVLEREYAQQVSAFERQRFHMVLRSLLSQLNGVSSNEACFWRQELRNLGFASVNAWGFERRDEGMASNLLWLARERHPGKKIIVWAHNYHIAKSTELVVENPPSFGLPLPQDTLLGEVVAREFSGSVYSLGLISGGGTYHPYTYRGDHETVETVEPPAPDSLEVRLWAEGRPTAFVDFRKMENLEQPFVMSGVEHNRPRRLPWAEVFDGVVFIREMTGLNATVRST